MTGSDPTYAAVVALVAALGFELDDVTHIEIQPDAVVVSTDGLDAAGRAVETRTTLPFTWR